MQEQKNVLNVDSALAELIYKATEGADKGIDFLLTETPDVISQLLMWKTVSSLTCFVLGFITLFIMYKHFKLASKKPENGETNFYWTSWSHQDFHSPELGWCLFLFYIPFTIYFFGKGLVWLKIWIAPKVYLIEYASSLVK